MDAGVDSEAIAVLLLVAFAGCLGAAPPDPDTPSTPPTPSDLATGEPPELPTERFANLTVGDPADLPASNASHTYLLWNNHSAEHSIGLTVWRDNTVALNRTVEFPAEGVLRIEVFRPGAYTLVIDPAGAQRTVVDAPDEFDCNYRVLETAIRSDGTLAVDRYQSVVNC